MPVMHGAGATLGRMDAVPSAAAPIRRPASEGTMAREFVDGALAISRAALDAGCDFFAGYPITPASGILAHMMRELPRRGGVCLQGEDEIASIGFCIAAAMTGRRVMTATSGPGMSLYSENIGLAVAGEVPMVIVNVQRQGPATGGATTGAEGDIQFVRWITSTGLPMVVLTPIDLATTYGLTQRAFALAEALRVPVILNTSKDLVLTRETIEADAWPRVEVKPRRAWTGGSPYLPHHFDALDEVPAFLPVGADTQVRFTGSMHDEAAVITKKPGLADRMIRHYAAKIDARAAELELADLDDDGGDVLFVASGVAARAARDAVARHRAADGKAALLVVYSVWPVPEAAIRRAAQGRRRVVVPELNLGLYRREIERVLPGMDVVGVNRVDGELLTADQLVEAM